MGKVYAEVGMNRRVIVTAAPVIVFILATALVRDQRAAAQNRTQLPRVLIDEGHNNYHTSKGGYAAYMRLLRQDGFEVAAERAHNTRSFAWSGCVRDLESFSRTSRRAPSQSPGSG
jgi:hypothetical protein